LKERSYVIDLCGDDIRYLQRALKKRHEYLLDIFENDSYPRGLPKEVEEEISQLDRILKSLQTARDLTRSMLQWYNTWEIPNHKETILVQTVDGIVDTDCAFVEKNGKSWHPMSYRMKDVKCWARIPV